MSNAAVITGSGAPPERKRTRKPCSNCINAKVACDQQRPCARCVKHGWSPSCVDIPRKQRASKKQKQNQNTNQTQSQNTNQTPDYQNQQLIDELILPTDETITHTHTQTKQQLLQIQEQLHQLQAQQPLQQSQQQLIQLQQSLQQIQHNLYETQPELTTPKTITTPTTPLTPTTTGGDLFGYLEDLLDIPDLITTTTTTTTPTTTTETQNTANYSITTTGDYKHTIKQHMNNIQHSLNILSTLLDQNTTSNTTQQLPAQNTTQNSIETTNSPSIPFATPTVKSVLLLNTPTTTATHNVQTFQPPTPNHDTQHHPMWMYCDCEAPMMKLLNSSKVITDCNKALATMLSYGSTPQLLFGNGVISLYSLTPERFYPFMNATYSQVIGEDIKAFERPGAFVDKNGNHVYFIFKGELKDNDKEYGYATIKNIFDGENLPPIARDLLRI